MQSLHNATILQSAACPDPHRLVTQSAETGRTRWLRPDFMRLGEQLMARRLSPYLATLVLVATASAGVALTGAGAANADTVVLSSPGAVPTTSAVLVDRLVTAGHLTRTPDARDRRRVVLTATDHARAEVRCALRPLLDDVVAITARLDDHDRATVATFLTEVTTAMRAYATTEAEGVSTPD